MISMCEDVSDVMMNNRFGLCFRWGRGLGGITLYPSHHKRVTGAKDVGEKMDAGLETTASVWVEIEAVVVVNWKAGEEKGSASFNAHTICWRLCRGFRSNATPRIA